VYITGRTRSSLEKCAEEIKERGGKPVIVQVDHSVDSQVEALFDRIRSEQNNQLDLLVNNAYAGVNLISESMGKNFWETEPAETWDTINGVGLRNHYICTVLASRIMVENRKGLIINVSSGGGLRYLFNVCYGIGKSAVDRMAADCAVELKSSGVTMVSLWPGAVKTEAVQEGLLSNKKSKNAAIFSRAETVEFAGKCVLHLAASSPADLASKTGRILLSGDLAMEYGFRDVDGDMPAGTRQVNFVLGKLGYVGLAAWVPDWIRIPHALLHMMSNKF